MASESIESLCQKARQAIAQGQIEQARQVYLQALGVRGDVPDVHYGLATACFLLNDFDSAAYHFKEVTRLDPLRPGAYINLGAVYNRLDQYEDAVQALRRGIQLDPHRAEGYYNLGLVYRSMGQLNLALQAYIEATRIDPRKVDAQYNLGNVYMEMGRAQLAVAHYKKVLQLRPNWDRANEALGRAEKALGVAQTPPPSPPPIPASTAAPAPEVPSANLNRAVDPAHHGELLAGLHHATIDSESHGRQFLQILEREVEPAIKELSSRLLATETGQGDLGQCVKRFEHAIQTMRTAHKELESSFQKVRALGEKLLKY